MADEVSEQPVESTPVEQPAPAPVQEARIPTAPEPVQQPAPVSAQEVAEQPEEQTTPPDVAELEAIVNHLESLHHATKKANDALHHVHDQEQTQKVLETYSTTLAELPQVLQKLNDYRRHFTAIAAHAEQVRAQLVQIRGADDALSSEETRVIVTTASVSDIVLGLIQSLENMFTHVRAGTRILLQVIGYHEPGFEEFTKKSLTVLKTHAVLETLDQTLDTTSRFLDDMNALHELDAHAQELQGNV